jgi:hypothetical protein
MTRLIIAIWMSVIAVAGTCLPLLAIRAVRSYNAADQDRARLQEASLAVERLIELKSKLAGIPAAGAIPGGLTARVTSVLQQAGLSVSALSSLSPEAETPIFSKGGAHAYRRRATLVLADLSLSHVGTFLAAWRDAEPSWTPVAVELSPIAGKAEAGSDQPLRAVITIETTSVRQDGEAK